MIRKNLVLLVALAALASSAAAAPTCQDRDDLAWLFAPEGLVGLANKALCQASCAPYSEVSCSYTPPSTCTAVDRNCAVGQAGYVQCGSNPAIPCGPGCSCTNGTFKWEIVGCCEDGSGRVLKDRYLCVEGEWEYQYTACGLPATCPRFP